MYAITQTIGWSDLDANHHMRSPAYLDKVANMRMAFFADNGFPVSEIFRAGLGPVVVRDEVEYFKEIGFMQVITITLAIAGMSTDGSRFIMHNEFIREDGRLCATVRSSGSWIGITSRKRMAPPAALLTVMMSLPQTADFITLGIDGKNIAATP